MPDRDAALESIFELADKTPFEALTSAYASRLWLVRSRATASELADNAVWISDLERAVALRAVAVPSAVPSVYPEPALKQLLA